MLCDSRRPTDGDSGHRTSGVVRLEHTATFRAPGRVPTGPGTPTRTSRHGAVGVPAADLNSDQQLQHGVEHEGRQQLCAARHHDEVPAVPSDADDDDPYDEGWASSCATAHRDDHNKSASTRSTSPCSPSCEVSVRTRFLFSTSDFSTKVGRRSALGSAHCANRCLYAVAGLCTHVAGGALSIAAEGRQSPARPARVARPSRLGWPQAGCASIA